MTASADLSVLAGKRILLVEDEAFVAMNLEMALEDVGAVVVGPMMRLETALEAAETGKHDAAILDVDLAGDDVFPCARILRQDGTPFVFHTGHGQRRELQVDFPGAPVAKKPTKTDDLLGILAGLLQAAS